MSTRNIDILRRQIKKGAQRADLNTSALSTGGKLATEVFDKFIKIAQDATPILQGCRVVKMKSHTTQIPKLVFSGRMMKAPPAEAADVASGDRTAPTPSQIVLAAKKTKGRVLVTYEMLEDNVEESDFENTLLALIAQKWGIDTEELMLNGDTASGDTYLAILNGWLKLLTSNTVAAGGAALNATILGQAYQSIPLKFRQQAKAMKTPHRFFVEDHAAQAWADIVGGRQTGAGDKYLLEGEVPPYKGLTIEPAANLPVTAGSPNTAPAILTPPRNLIMGVWREMRVRIIDKPELECFYFDTTCRVAAAVEQEDAACKITGVKAA